MATFDAPSFKLAVSRACPSAIETSVCDLSFFVKLTSEREARALFALIDGKLTHSNIRQRPGFWIVNGRV